MRISNLMISKIKIFLGDHIEDFHEVKKNKSERERNPNIQENVVKTSPFYR